MVERCVSVEIFLECRQKNNRRSQLFKATWQKVEQWSEIAGQKMCGRQGGG